MAGSWLSAVLIGASIASASAQVSDSNHERITCYERQRDGNSLLQQWYKLFDEGEICEEGVRTCFIQSEYGAHERHVTMECGPVCPLDSNARRNLLDSDPNCHARCWKTELNDKVGYESCLCEGDRCNGVGHLKSQHIMMLVITIMLYKI